MIGSLALALALAAAEPYLPPPANEYVSTTPKYLYVVWALPKDLGPLKGLDAPARRELIARTALALCDKHKAKAGERACLVHLLRLDSNDEYSTALANSYVTLGKLVLPREKLGASADKLPKAELEGQFQRFQLEKPALE